MKFKNTITVLAFAFLTLTVRGADNSPIPQEKTASAEAVHIAPQYLSEIRVIIGPGSPTVIIKAGSQSFFVPESVFGVADPKANETQNQLAMDFAEGLKKAKHLKLYVFRLLADPNSAEVASIELTY